ncbi:MAG TPA: chorismate mutase [Gammaproteobacteria bacterium]
MNPATKCGAPWQLLEMRAKLRLIDTQLIVLLSRRFELQRDVRTFKHGQGMPLHDSAREADVLAHCTDLAESLDVPLDIVRTLYAGIFEKGRGNPAQAP